MPTYEYKCTKCGAIFEVMRGLNAPPLAVCGKYCVAEGQPADGEVVKIISRVAAQTGGRSGEAPASKAGPAAPSAELPGHVCGPGCMHGRSGDSSVSCVGDQIRRKYGLDP